MSISFPSSLPNTSSVMNQPLSVNTANPSVQSAAGRNPLALDVLYITSNEDFLENISKNLKKNAELSNVPMEILYLEQLRGDNKKERISELKNQLKDLHENGKIDEKTQIIIHVHGSINDHPHELSNKKNDFSISTMELVDLIRNSKKSSEASVNSDSWDGTIHIGACGAARAGLDLKEDVGMNLLYAGKNVKLGMDSAAIFSDIIRLLGEYRKDVTKNAFPTAHQFYESAGKISGEKITLSGKGNLCHIRSTYLPLPTDLVRQDVVDKLEKSLLAKLMHGKATTVKKITELLGPMLKNIKFCDPLFLFATVGGNDAEEKLKILIEAGIEINKIFHNETTALHLAAENGKKDEALLLIKYGAKINAKNKVGETPLATAIRAGNIEMIKCLIEAGADIDVTDRDGNSALRVAFEKEDKDFIGRLLDKGLSAFSKNLVGRSVFEDAISAKRSDIVKLTLLKSSQSDLSEGEDYESALFHALSENEPELVRAMIKKSPDKKNVLVKLFTELREKITENNESFQFDSRLFDQHKFALKILVRLLLESNDSMPDYFQEYLMTFMGSRHEEYLPVTLAVPNLGDKWSSDLEMLRDVFLEMGLKEASDLFGASVTLKSELSERVDPDLFQLYKVDSDGLTPFQRACSRANLAELIILDNIEPNLKFSLTPSRQSPLMLSCRANAGEVVKWLLDKGVDRELQDARGKTALGYALEQGNAEIEQEIRTRFRYFQPSDLN